MNVTTLDEAMALSTLIHGGASFIDRIARRLDRPGWILGASMGELQKLDGVTGDKATRIRQILDDFDPHRERQRMAEHQIVPLPLSDPGYPPWLAGSPAPPWVIYVRGRLPVAPMFGIVGTRAATAYGLEIAHQLGRDLARAGHVVVSGLARGIDRAAHEGALKARPALQESLPGNGTRVDASTSAGLLSEALTVAVVGCGLDRCYPPEHRELSDRITRAGAVVSEYPLGSPPRAYHFPRRNRIIAALSRGIVVVQCPLESGAMITARQALDAGRDVFAVPGPVGLPQSAGPLSLLRSGAILATGAGDILSEYGVTPDPVCRSRDPILEGNEATVHAELDGIGSNVDVLRTRTGLEVSAVLTALGGLAVKGLAQRLPGGYYSRRFLGDEEPLR